MNNTKINWTEVTWNPVTGCVPVSEGCKYCYAKKIAERGMVRAFPNGFDLTLRPHKLSEPIKLKNQSLIFVNSMSDLFWDQVPTNYVHQIIEVMRDTPQHRYQVLTKRPERMLAYFEEFGLPDNFWAGTTIESGRLASRLDILKRVNVPIRFLSIEPLISRWEKPDFSGIQWVITGGESGFHLRDGSDVLWRRGLVMKVFGRWVPRPDRKDWIREIRDACVRDDVNFWHKQWGGPRPKSAGRELDGLVWAQRPALINEEAQPALL